MNYTLKYVSLKSVIEVFNLFFYLINEVMNPAETSVHVEVHSPIEFLQCFESTQILW